MAHIGDKQLGSGNPCFITFEAGPTHDGVDSAKALIDAAVEAGGDAIKFQIFDPNRLVADRKLMFSYTALVDKNSGRTEEVSEPLYDILKRRHLEKAQWKEVKSYADQRGLQFFATVGFDEDVDLVVSLGCTSIKIASADVDHLPLIRRVARTGLSIQLDTGNSTLGELESAVRAASECGNENIVIHQCPSGYPARLESINLRMLKSLKVLFPECGVAYSDHTPDHDMDIAAVALGADLIEKTITLDKTTRSPEHIMSLEPWEMTDFVKRIRDVEKALGSTRRMITSEQDAARRQMRRSIHIGVDLEDGAEITEEVLDFRRPGDGMPVSMLEKLMGKKLLRHKSAGERLDWADVDW